MISNVVVAIALYSTFTEDLKTVLYFLDLQEIRESPKNTL